MSSNLINAARKLFRAFHEREPEAHEIVETPPAPREVLVWVGALIEVVYEVDNGQQYVHEFSKSDRPGLYVTTDGQQAYIVAGQYVFTERGFVK